MSWVGATLDHPRRCVVCGATIDAGRIVSETAQWFVARSTHVECALAPTWGRGFDSFSIAPDAMPAHAIRQAQLRAAFNRRAIFGNERLDTCGWSIDSRELDRAVHAGEIEPLEDHLGRPIVKLSIDLDWRGRGNAWKSLLGHRERSWARTAKYCFEVHLAGVGAQSQTYPGLARGTIFAVDPTRSMTHRRAWPLWLAKQLSMPTPLVWIVGGPKSLRNACEASVRTWLDYVGYPGDLAHVFHGAAVQSRRNLATLLEAFEASQHPEHDRATPSLFELADDRLASVARLESYAADHDWNAVSSMIRFELSLRPLPRRRGDTDPRIARVLVRWLDEPAVRRVVLDYLAVTDDRSLVEPLANWLADCESKPRPPTRDMRAARAIVERLERDSAERAADR